MPTIRIENAAKLYTGPVRKTAAALDLDLTVEQGEFVFVIGSRGAGKTTLLDLICGELEPDRGIITVDGINVNRPPLKKRRYLRDCFGVVGQEPMLNYSMTVFENMCDDTRFRRIYNQLFNREIIAKALALVGMAESGDKYPLELSVSECRRVELARALMHSPPILILDEITDKLDSDTIWDIFHLLQELNRRGTTIIMATKSSQFVNIMRRRVITLSDGKIVGDAPNGRFGDLS